MLSSAQILNKTQLLTEFDCELMAPNSLQGALVKFWDANCTSLLSEIQKLPVTMQLDHFGKKTTERYSIEEFVLKLALKLRTKKISNQEPSLNLYQYIKLGCYNSGILNIINAITSHLKSDEFKNLHLSLKNKIDNQAYDKKCELIILFKANYNTGTPRTPFIQKQMSALNIQLLEIAEKRKIQIANLSTHTGELDFEEENLRNGERLEFEKEDLDDDEEPELNEDTERTVAQPNNTDIPNLPFYSHPPQPLENPIPILYVEALGLDVEPAVTSIDFSIIAFNLMLHTKPSAEDFDNYHRQYAEEFFKALKTLQPFMSITAEGKKVSDEISVEELILNLILAVGHPPCLNEWITYFINRILQTLELRTLLSLQTSITDKSSDLIAQYGITELNSEVALDSLNMQLIILHTNLNASIELKKTTTQNPHFQPSMPSHSSTTTICASLGVTAHSLQTNNDIFKAVEELGRPIHNRTRPSSNRTFVKSIYNAAPTRIAPPQTLTPQYPSIHPNAH